MSVGYYNLFDPPKPVEPEEWVGPGLGRFKAVQLTEANFWNVFEWAHSKPFRIPAPSLGAEPPIAGLTLLNPNRSKVMFGDWIILTRGGRWLAMKDAEPKKEFVRVSTDV